MLALRTGWTDHTIADGITDDFRRACHHAMYAELIGARYLETRRLVEQAESVDITTIPTSGRAALRTMRQALGADLTMSAALLGLDDGS